MCPSLTRVQFGRNIPDTGVHREQGQLPVRDGMGYGSAYRPCARTRNGARAARGAKRRERLVPPVKLNPSRSARIARPARPFLRRADHIKIHGKGLVIREIRENGVPLLLALAR